ncbi:hypothetical protein Taro_056619 [Colocasia esculenta]|uniref:Secreted protein n=1 Tax=Colocasia esculenta TaxID=4460 RepID=A0A843XWQ8_COLES|nr:hypothetical protein [Colocasia esculenta]
MALSRSSTGPVAFWMYPIVFLTKVVSTLDQVVSTPCSKHKTKSRKTGQVVSTLVQVVSTLETFSEHHLGSFGTVCRHYLK